MNYEVMIPPYDEQCQIAEYLDYRIKEIDDILSKKEFMISELKAYKKAMIFEYTTGKKEV